MLNKAIRILNFDNSIIQQSKFLSEYSITVTDFTCLAPTARLFMSGAVRQQIADVLKPEEQSYPTFNDG